MSALFKKGREGLIGAINLSSDDIRHVLVDLNDLSEVKAITGATNATPIVITSNSHGFANGAELDICHVGGNTNANGHRVVANQAANTYELTDPVTGANIAGNAAYTSGGFAIPMGASALDNLDDVASGARIATSGAYASKTITDGVFDAADISHSSVSGDPAEAIFVYLHTGTESTSTLIASLSSGTGLPVTPNGGNINVNFDSGAKRIFAII